jgi:hypothetical protein
VSGHHGDIMQRLLEHQRELRDTVPPTGATRRLAPAQGLIDYALLERVGSATTSVLDLTGVEAGVEDERTTERLAELRATLAAIQRDLNDARRRAYDAVLSLDDRLADLERRVAEAAAVLDEPA